MTGPMFGKPGTTRRAPDLALDGEERSRWLRAKGEILCDHTAELVLRSRRAMDRSRVLVVDSRRIVGRANPGTGSS